MKQVYKRVLATLGVVVGYLALEFTGTLDLIAPDYPIHWRKTPALYQQINPRTSAATIKEASPSLDSMVSDVPEPTQKTECIYAK